MAQTLPFTQPKACHNHQHCIAEALEKAERVCQRQNLRFTEIRQTVFRLVWQRHSPVKAYEILEQLQQQGIAAKPPTVYRALDFLLEHQLIHKLHRLNAYTGCMHPSPLTPCLFLICTGCESAEEIRDDALIDLLHNVRNKQGFATFDMTLELEGMCKECLG
jgi:Fur family zinc uptake transcriptional regulator